MRAGSLDRRLTIERATETRDAFNEPVLTWAPLATVWAGYTPVSDGERFRAGERAADISARFVIRHSSQVAGLSPKDRAVFEGAAYDILNVKEVGRRVGLEITCAARGDQA